MASPSLCLLWHAFDPQQASYLSLVFRGMSIIGAGQHSILRLQQTPETIGAIPIAMFRLFIFASALLATSANADSAPTPTPTPLPAWIMLDGSQCAPGDRKWLIIGSEDVFCLPSSARACAGAYANGMQCPGPQLRLPYGSSCRFIGESDNVGCYPNNAAGQAISGYAPVELPAECRGGLRVTGLGGHYCVKDGARCQGGFGLCPHTQQGLPYGSYCKEVDWQYYECFPSAPPAPAPSPIIVTPAPTTVAPTKPTPTAPAPTKPAPTTPAPTKSVPVATPVPVSRGPSPGSLPTCKTGQSRMSVEGVVTVYCVTEPVCTSTRPKGNCPGPQRGLPFGSYCGLLQRSRVYGCKPKRQ